MSARIWSRVLAFVLVAGAAFWFTVENAARRVTVDLLLFRVSTSVPLVVFGSVMVGMLTVFLVGLRADLQTRRTLRRLRRGLGPEPPPMWDGRDEEPPEGERSREEVARRS